MHDAADRIGCWAQIKSHAYEKILFLFEGADTFLRLHSIDVGNLFCWHVL
jgi:hypothetical protein